MANLDAIYEELKAKFSGSVYDCNPVLDSIKKGGTTHWVLQYTERSTGERKPEYDGLIKRTSRGTTSVL